MNSITKEHNTVKHENGPEYINLECFETGTDNAHEEYERKSLPHLHLTHRPDQWLLIIRDYLVKEQNLFLFSSVYFSLLLSQLFRGEIADYQLQYVEKD